VSPDATEPTATTEVSTTAVETSSTAAPTATLIGPIVTSPPPVATPTLRPGTPLPPSGSSASALSAHSQQAQVVLGFLSAAAVAYFL
jgi:hypothetical protein